MVADTTPTFSGASVDDQSYTAAEMIEALTLPAATGGNGDLTYGISPDLPTGLAFDAATRIISGTPGAAMAETEYTYAARDADGDEVTLTFDITVAASASAPAPLAAIEALVGDTQVTLRWNAVAGATKYQVRHRQDSASSAFNAYTDVTGTTTTITGLTNGQAYEFGVRAVNAVGASEALREKATPADLTPSFAPGASIAAQSYVGGTAITPLNLPLATGGNLPLTYSLSSNLPAGLRLELSGSSEPNRLVGAPNDGVGGSFTITYTATDSDPSNPETATLSFTVNVNARPVFSTPATFSVPENRASVGAVTAADADASDSITGYALGGSDEDYFTLENGQLSFSEVPDYEDPQGGVSRDSNEYELTVTATSGTGGRELSNAQMLRITVTDVAEPPSPPAAPTLDQATTDSLRVNWTPPTNTGPAISGYDVRSRKGGTGEFSAPTRVAATARSLTLDDLDEASSYEAQVRAINADGEGDWSPAGTGTTATAGNAPPAFSSPASFSVDENSLRVGRVLATDLNAEDSINSYTLSGTDAALFSLDSATGELRFLAAPNFEAPQGGAGDDSNDYAISVRVTSGAGVRELFATQSITVSVNDLEDNQPTITIARTDPTQTSVAEGTTLGYTLTRVGGGANQGAPVTVNLTLSQTGGTFLTDGVSTASAAFAQDATTVTGTVATVDDSADEPDGTVTITIAESNASYVRGAARSISFDLTDNDNGAPAIETIAAQTGDVGAPFQVTVSATDPEGDALQYSASSSATGIATVTPGSLTALRSGSSTVTVTPVATGTATITVTVSDGTLSSTSTFQVTVNADVEPAFASTDSIPNQVLDTSDDVDVTLPKATGGNGALTYSISPALPTGLRLQADSDPPKLVGRPTATAASATYTYKVTDVDGDEDTLTFTLEVGLPTGGICARTAVVQHVILAAIEGVTSCSNVTAENLRTITALTLDADAVTAAGVSTTVTLAVGDFSGLNGLTSLELDALRGLTSLPAQLLGGLGKLATFELTGATNTTVSIPNTLFSGLTALTSVKLEDIGLSAYPKTLLDGLPGIVSIDLSDNLLSALPVGAFEGKTAINALDFRSNAQALLLTLAFERVGSAPLVSGASGVPAMVRARVTEGAPFAITVPWTASGEIAASQASSGSVTIPAGALVSETFSISGDTSANPSVNIAMGTVTPAVSSGAISFGTNGRAQGLAYSKPSAAFTLSFSRNSVPDFGSKTVADQTYRVGLAITDLTLPAATGGNGDLTYTLTPALPAGLSLDANTRVLGGTPSALSSEQEYTWAVADADANTEAADTDTITFDLTVNLPWPQGITATARDTEVVLGWTSVGEGITYDVRFRKGTDRFAIPESWTPLTGTEYTATGLTNGTEYDFQVRSRFGSGSTAVPGPWSDTVSATPEANTAPTISTTFTDLTLNRGDAAESITLTATDSDTGQTLQYKAVSDDTDVATVTPLVLTNLDSGTSAIEVTPVGLGEATITVTVDDGQDETEATFMVTVANRAPTVANAIPDQTARVGTAFEYIFPDSTFSDADSDTLTYTFMRTDGTTDSALPGWLASTPAERKLAGTPGSGDIGTLMVKVTASDGNGGTISDTFDIVVSAADTAPAFADSATIADQTFTVDAEITAFTLPEASGGNGTISYALTPGLPAGLSVDTGTREVSGTPTAAAAQATYTWRASDSDANTADTDSNALTFSLTVNKATLAAPTGLALKANSQTSTGFTITWTAVSNAAGYTASAMRADGMGTAAAGTVSGTDTEAVFTGLTAGTDYKVTVTATGDANYANSPASAEFDASTAADTAPAFADGTTIADKTFTVDAEITAFTLPAATGGNGTISYALTPDLPAGLSLNESTREVSGTPTAAAAQATYTWRASDGDANTADSDSNALTFMLTVNKATLAAPTGLALKENSQTSTGFTITWTAVSNAAGYTASAMRADGMGTAAAGTVSGTNTEAVFTGLTAGTAYKVTVTATGDANYANSPASAEFDASTAAASVADTAPAFADSATITDKTFTVDAEITAFTLPEATGGNGTISYALTPDLPTGLSLNESTREVSGTPTAAAAQASYTWRASDSDANTADSDSDSLTFMLTVNKATLAAPTSLALKENSQTSSGFTITWTAVSNAAGYTASAMRADGTGTAVAGTVSGTDTEAVFTGLTASTAYKVTVTATGDDNYANSPASAEFDASTVAPAAGICGRTEAVRTAILAKISGVSECADVTSTQLAAITGSLQLSRQNIRSLKAGDFAGLTGLTTLNIARNPFTTLPAGIFDSLTSLTDLLIFQTAGLRSLPDDIFEPLTRLTTLRLEKRGGVSLNFRPTANAGADQSVSLGAGVVTLAGTATGPWGNNVTWAWTQVDGANSNTAVSSGAVTLANAATATPSFTAPSAAASLHFRLIVTPVPAPAPGTAGCTGCAVSEADWVTITVGDANNQAPTVANAIPDQVALVGAPFSYTFPANTFDDPDGDALTYTVSKSDDSALPGWLTFDPGTRRFTGTPPSSAAGRLSLKVTATDSGRRSVSDTFDILVSPPLLDGLALALPDGTAVDLTPAFNGATKTYTATVPDGTGLVDLTPTASSTPSGITVTVDGVLITSGAAKAVTLFGASTEVRVVARKPSPSPQVDEYFVTIAPQNPPASEPETLLSALRLKSGDLVLTESSVMGTDPTVIAYRVPSDVTSLRVTPTVDTAGATVTVNGKAVASGAPSASIPLNIGVNTIVIVVTSPDGMDSRTYRANVQRGATLGLSALTLATGTLDGTTFTPVSTGILNPSFSPVTLEYRVVVDRALDSLRVTPTVATAGATVTVNGTAVTSGSASGVINLPTGRTGVIHCGDGGGRCHGDLQHPGVPSRRERRREGPGAAGCRSGGSRRSR